MFLFGESQNRVVVSVAAGQQEAYEKELQNKSVNFTKLSKVTAHGSPIDGNLLYRFKVAKKHDDTALEQISD